MLVIDLSLGVVGAKDEECPHCYTCHDHQEASDARKVVEFMIFSQIKKVQHKQESVSSKRHSHDEHVVFLFIKPREGEGPACGHHHHDAHDEELGTNPHHGLDEPHPPESLAVVTVHHLVDDGERQQDDFHDDGQDKKSHRPLDPDPR